MSQNTNTMPKTYEEAIKEIERLREKINRSDKLRKELCKNKFETISIDYDTFKEYVCEDDTITKQEYEDFKNEFELDSQTYDKIYQDIAEHFELVRSDLDCNLDYEIPIEEEDEE